jgi:hypothetical protein
VPTRRIRKAPPSASVDEPDVDAFEAPVEFEGLIAGTELLVTSRTIEVRHEYPGDSSRSGAVGRAGIEDVHRVEVRPWPAGPATVRMWSDSGDLEIVMRNAREAERVRTVVEAARSRLRSA